MPVKGGVSYVEENIYGYHQRVEAVEENDPVEVEKHLMKNSGYVSDKDDNEKNTAFAF